MSFMTMFGTGVGAYIMAMAALSPCPALVHSESGTVVIVSACHDPVIVTVAYHDLTLFRSLM